MGLHEQITLKRDLLVWILICILMPILHKGAHAWLVPVTVFKTDGFCYAEPVGSIPTRSR